MYITTTSMPVNQKTLPVRRLPAGLPRRRLGSKRQQRFLLSVKLLLKSLESSNGSNVDRYIAQQVKLAVRECIRQNRAGDKGAIPLQAKLEMRLQEIVGPEMLADSMILVDLYQAKRSLRQSVRIPV